MALAQTILADPRLRELHTQLANESGVFRAEWTRIFSTADDREFVINLGFLARMLKDGTLLRRATRDTETRGAEGVLDEAFESFGGNPDSAFDRTDISNIEAFFARMRVVSPGLATAVDEARKVVGGYTWQNPVGVPAPAPEGSLDDPFEVWSTGARDSRSPGQPGQMRGWDPSGRADRPIQPGDFADLGISGDPNGPDDNSDPTMIELLKTVAAGLHTTVVTIVALVQLIILVLNGGERARVLLVNSGAVAAGIPRSTFVRRLVGMWRR